MCEALGGESWKEDSVIRTTQILLSMAFLISYIYGSVKFCHILYAYI